MPRGNGFTYKTWLRRYERGAKWPKRITIIGALWTDACHSSDGDTTAGTIKSFVTGAVIEDTKEHLKVAFELFDDQTVRDVTTIPSVLVKRVYPLGSTEFPS